MLDVPMVPDHVFMAVDFVESDTFKPFIIPVAGLAIGCAMMAVPHTSGTAGRLALYFGAHEFNKHVWKWMSRVVVQVWTQRFPNSPPGLEAWEQTAAVAATTEAAAAGPQTGK